jgi:chromosome segregation ATPase
MKLRKLTITGFRGARFPLTIDLTANNKSLSVFGENASGKSTITDALEWFITGKVAHLWREDCREDSLRNVLLDDTDLSEVTVEFSDGTSNSKRLDAKLSITHATLDIDFLESIGALSKDRVFLRYAQIAQFIQRSKSEKRKAIAEIIGYESISNFRNTIQTTMNSLQRDSQYSAAKHRVEEEKKSLLRMAGRLISTPQMLYEQMNLEINRAGFDLNVHDKNSYVEVIQELRTKINQQERVEKKLRLQELIKDIGSLRTKLITVKEKASSLEDYNAVIAGLNVVGQLHGEVFGQWSSTN